MSAITTIPLDHLCRSALNVRTTEPDADIPALAEAIGASGLKQNLVVVPADPLTAIVGDRVVAVADWGALYEVTAGGRRFQALSLLAAEGRLPADHPVPCLIEEREAGRTTSLDENLHKVAMNPADEFEAFAQIAGQHEAEGSSRSEAIARCAKRYGKTIAYVEGRLRLADLAADILEALRSDRIGVEAAKAYAAVSDHKLQLQVFKERERDTWHGHKPATIRERLRGKTLALTDRRVAFVGLDAYLAAGGRTETEMFMGEKGEERLIDPGKLDKLARVKAEEALASLARKDGFKEGLYAAPGTYAPNWPKAPKGFQRHHQYYGVKKPTKAQLKKSIGVYAIARDGSGLEHIGRFRPNDEQKTPQPSYQPTPEELAEQRRERGIATIAARLAVGPFTATPFEGRAFWPRKSWIAPVERINDDELYIAVLVKVTNADIDAQREAAAAKYDTEQAEADAEALRQAEALADKSGDDVGDVLDEMESEDETFEAEAD